MSLRAALCILDQSSHRFVDIRTNDQTFKNIKEPGEQLCSQSARSPLTEKDIHTEKVLGFEEGEKRLN